MPDPKRVAEQIRRRTSLRPSLAIVLGSGFGQVASALEVECKIPFEALAGFPKPTVAGHAGAVLIGRLAGEPVLVQAGRSHYYEGFAMHVITFPIRVFAAFGIKALLLTNAAGGINPKLRVGDFMLVRDHINFMGANPLRGQCHPGLTQFVDLSRAYDAMLNRLLSAAARAAKVTLKSGVYIAVSGPSYETPAEIRAFARLGADAVGMSTVPEVIVAKQCGLRVAAVSCITNLAAGKTKSPVSHQHVLDVAATAGQAATALLTNFVRLYHHSAEKLSGQRDRA
ncbi:MAG: purine-nucleoside phosphorylase [Verrucomicrobiales bacterium]|nr:purine-nucleoside phosphorylase [Verrucomicrobiales bacterium]